MKKLSTILFFICTIFNLMAQENLTLKYRNVLNIMNIPADPKDLTSFAFCDLGSWTGYALPGENDKEYWGCFTGPYSVSEGIWLSKSLVKFSIKDEKTGREYDISEGKPVEISYYPGMLTQKFFVENISIELFLFFISSKPR